MGARTPAQPVSDPASVRWGRPLAIRGLHLLVLCGFALAQPLFDLLGATPEFFVTRDSTSWDVVILGVGLVIGPPVILLGVEALAGLVHPRVQDLVHLAFVAALTALIALQALRRLGELPGWPLVAGALVLGVVAAAAYARLAPIRTIVTVLAPAPFIFLALFLVNAPLASLRATSAGEAGTSPLVASQTPVAMIVFDELPLASLLDADGRVDGRRYPGFGALAADATWFPYATTVHDHTGAAMPAILTGKNPEEGALPLVADHPQNLFTYLARSYRMHVLEPVTQLCPADVCERQRPSFAQRMRSLASDLRVVYLHVTLPETLADDLPPIDETWQDFNEGGSPGATDTTGTEEQADGAVADQLWSDQRSQFERWVAGIEPGQGSRPTLNFLHTLLPHRPWRYLPSGKQYGSAPTDGLRRDVWRGEEWLVTQAYQRHLLQVGFADHLLETALARLRQTGLYDRSLIVVAADHGASFRPGGRRREADSTNLADIAFVPLFVKRPGQTEGEIDTRNARTTDILPTIADVIGTPLPRPVDGRSLLSPADSERATVDVRSGGGVVSAPSTEAVAALAELVADKVSVFGAGAWESVYAIGPHPELLGRPVSSLTVAAASELSATVDSESLLRDLALASPLVPANVTGQITGEGSEPPLDLAVGVNGRIAAVTRAVELGGGTRFSAMVPESAFREGPNFVEVFAVRPSAAGNQLERLLGGGADGRLETSAGSETIRLENGRRIAVVAGALDGVVEDWIREPETVRFAGWAGDVDHGKLADRILVFADGRLVYSTATSFRRPDVANAQDLPEGAGFVFELPVALIGDAAKLRLFATRGERASELSYPSGVPRG